MSHYTVLGTITSMFVGPEVMQVKKI